MSQRPRTLLMTRPAQSPTRAEAKERDCVRDRFCHLLASAAALCVAMFMAGAVQVKAQAAEKAGVTFSDTLTQNGKQLQLNGLGLRTKLFFKVYVAGLYVEKKSTDPSALISAPGEKHLKLHFLRDVDAEKIREAWNEGYKANCRERCEETAKDVNTLNTWMMDMKEGDSLEFTFADDAFTVAVNGESKGSISAPSFAQNILAIFLGKNPPNAELKEGLLGNG